MTAAALAQYDLWWTGPPWLKKASALWPIPDTSTPAKTIIDQTLLETRLHVTHHVDGTSLWELPNKYSSWTKLVRVTAYVLRFVANLKSKTSALPMILTSLQVSELRNASKFWLRQEQSAQFAKKTKALSTGNTVKNSSSLRSLHPILGDDALIRLGGRLKNSAFSYSERHPIILPKGRVAELLIAQAHKATLHSGTQLTLRTLRQRYWILGTRGLVKSHIRQCLICARQAAAIPTQLMGNLPTPKVTPSAPFSHTGVDYAGPFHFIHYVGRGQRTTKHYVSLFICLATKAIHLKCVDDYAAAGFLAAFQRFASRRGLPSHMYSDNGTNFHGADRELQRNFKVIRADPFLHDALANDRVQLS